MPIEVERQRRRGIVMSIKLAENPLPHRLDKNGLFNFRPTRSAPWPPRRGAGPHAAHSRRDARA